MGDFLCGVGLNRYELGEGGRGGAGATDEDETNGRSMTIMNKVGLKLSPSPVTSLLWRSQIVPAAAGVTETKKLMLFPKSLSLSLTWVGLVGLSFLLSGENDDDDDYVDVEMESREQGWRRLSFAKQLSLS